MKFGIRSLLFLVSIHAYADTECQSMDKSRSEYTLICEKDPLQNRIDRMAAEVKSNGAFIIKWRLDKDNSPEEKADLENIGILVGHANEAIRTLANIYCKAELGPGARIVTGSQSENRELCLRGEVAKQKITLYEKLVEYTQVEKPSFDCEKSVSRVEKEICSSHNLAVLDKEISQFYARISNIKEAKESQLYWVNKVRNPCSISPNVASCLDQVMGSRLRELSEQSSK